MSFFKRYWSALLAVLAGVGLTVAWWMRRPPDNGHPRPHENRSDSVDRDRFAARQQMEGRDRLKALTATLGGSEATFKRDVVALLGESQRAMSDEERRRFEVSRREGADLLDYEIGRKVCSAMSSQFSTASACAAWEGRADLSVMRDEMNESLHTPEDVYRAKRLIGRLSNYHQLLHERLRGQDVLNERYLSDAYSAYIVECCYSYQDARVLSIRDTPSTIPVFSVEEGYALLALTKIARDRLRGITVVGEGIPEFVQAVEQPGLPRIDAFTRDEIIRRLRADKLRAERALNVRGMQHLIGKMREDYKFFEDYYRILSGEAPVMGNPVVSPDRHSDTRSVTPYSPSSIAADVLHPRPYPRPEARSTGPKPMPEMSEAAACTLNEIQSPQCRQALPPVGASGRGA